MSLTATIPDLNPALRAITALSELSDNGDTIVTEAALDAFQAGRAAFWSTATYSNQKAMRLIMSANRAGLAYALPQIANDRHGSYAAWTPYLLGTLVPLNLKAREEINRAWADWADTPRERNANVAEPFRSTLNAVGL